MTTKEIQSTIIGTIVFVFVGIFIICVIIGIIGRNDYVGVCEHIIESKMQLRNPSFDLHQKTINMWALSNNSGITTGYEAEMTSYKDEGFHFNCYADVNRKFTFGKAGSTCWYADWSMGSC